MYSVQAELEQFDLDTYSVQVEVVEVVEDTHSVWLELEVVVKALCLLPCVLAVGLADASTWQCLTAHSSRSELASCLRLALGCRP